MPAEVKEHRSTFKYWYMSAANGTNMEHAGRAVKSQGCIQVTANAAYTYRTHMDMGDTKARCTLYNPIMLQP